MTLPSLLRITQGRFKLDSHYKQAAQYLFRNPVSLEVSARGGPSSLWAVTGPEKTRLLAVIAGQYIADPPRARTYPFMASRYDHEKIQFLNFQEQLGLDRVHLSARYESFSFKGKLEMSDDVNCVRNYITGDNNYNSSKSVDPKYVDRLLDYFNLNHLAHKWINSLSNGQMRRARIAKLLVDQPSLLIVDDPFLGLDPEATAMVLDSLGKVSAELGTSIVVGLRIQDDIPEWVTHVAYVTEEGIDKQGPKGDVKLPKPVRHQSQTKKLGPIPNFNETPHIEFNKASVVYKDLPVLVDFTWKVPRGSKWRILGNNGTGKTTILSLITADHPQSWKSVISIDGTLRKTGLGVSFFDVNNKIGISSPELHALVPQHSRSMLDIILNGLVEDVGNSNFMYKGSVDQLGDFGRHIFSLFDDRLQASGHKLFRDLSITEQKLALFLRAIIKNPDILILDEAFSCMDDEALMHRCHDLIKHELSNTTVLAIGHIDWEVPECDYLLKLTGDENRSYHLHQYEDI